MTAKHMQKGPKNGGFHGGHRPVDGRSPAGRRINRLRKALIRDLGGDSVVSAQRGVLVELLVHDVVLLDLLDRQLLALGDHIVNRRARQAVKLLGERGTLADSVARRLTQLGLDRRGIDPAEALRRALATATPQQALGLQAEPDGGENDDDDDFTEEEIAALMRQGTGGKDELR